jgi:PAS domain S-box-containing protein
MTEKKKEIRRQAEGIVRGEESQYSEDIENIGALSLEETRQMLHELRVHQIELQIQNEELCIANTELDAVRARYFDLYDLAPIGYCTLSEKGLILEANLTAVTLLLSTRLALINRPIAWFIIKEDQTPYYFYRKQLFETGEPQACELRMVRKDGTLFWARLEGTVAKDADGASVIRNVISDITTRKQDENALRESRDRFREVLENSLDSSYKRNLKTNDYDYLSPVFARISGYTPDEMKTLPIETVKGLIHPEDLAEVESVIARSMTGATGTAYQVEYRFKHKCGLYRWFHDQFTLLRDEGGQPLALIGSARDITARKLAEKALHKSEASLRSLLAEKEILLKEVHHRVKNNLAAIMGLLDLQRHSIENELARTAMTELSARIRSMALVHEQFYVSEDLSRIDFQDYLYTLTAHLRSSYQRFGDIHVSVDAAGVTMGLDNAVPCGLFITELVTNAFKYAFPAGRPRPGNGGCEIAVSAKWDGAAYTLTVADSGVGLPAGLDWTKTKTLGLSLVKMLGRHQLQGQVKLDCTSGTRFQLRFEPGNKSSVTLVAADTP